MASSSGSCRPPEKQGQNTGLLRNQSDANIPALFTTLPSKSCYSFFTLKKYQAPIFSILQTPDTRHGAKSRRVFFQEGKFRYFNRSKTPYIKYKNTVVLFSKKYLLLPDVIK
jgi:hypothetical protein